MNLPPAFGFLFKQRSAGCVGRLTVYALVRTGRKVKADALAAKDNLFAQARQTAADLRATANNGLASVGLYSAKLLPIEIENSAELTALFRHVGGPNKPDIIGIGTFRGMRFDITTAQQIVPHLARPYGRGMDIIIYVRPAWLP